MKLTILNSSINCIIDYIKWKNQSKYWRYLEAVSMFVCLFGVYRRHIWLKYCRYGAKTLSIQSINVWVLSSNSIIFKTYMKTSMNGCKIWPLLGTHGHWAVRVLSRATPSVTRDIQLYWSYPRTHDCFCWTFGCGVIPVFTT